MTTRGSCCTAAKFIPSWKEPVLRAPSPTSTSPARGLLDEEFDRRLLCQGRRIRVAIVLGDDDEGQLLHRGEVHSFVEGAGAQGPVADVDQSRPRPSRRGI